MIGFPKLFAFFLFFSVSATRVRSSPPRCLPTFTVFMDEWLAEIPRGDLYQDFI